MNGRIGQTLKRTNLPGVARELRHAAGSVRWLAQRRFGQVDEALTQAYLLKHQVRKLHIGCGDNFIEGWLNSDLRPARRDVLHLDATERFPFEDQQFDFVFSEHMIEHIPYTSGVFMLRECHRILKRNGRVRISTPDLVFLIQLYSQHKTEQQQRYIEWATETFVPAAPDADAAFVINNFVRDWGHAFIYDEKTLRASMHQTGFTDVVKCALNESTVGVLTKLENEDRMPAGFLELESITLEGVKA